MRVSLLQLMVFYVILIAVAALIGSFVSGRTGVMIGALVGVALSAGLYVAVGRSMVSGISTVYY